MDEQRAALRADRERLAACREELVALVAERRSLQARINLRWPRRYAVGAEEERRRRAEREALFGERDRVVGAIAALEAEVVALEKRVRHEEQRVRQAMGLERPGRSRIRP